MITRLDNSVAISKRGKILLDTLHFLVLVASCIMIIWITRSTLTSMSFLVDTSYLNFQFWVCILFMIDIAVEWYYSQQKLRYIITNSLFIIISIPYLNIIHHFNLQLPGEVMYLIRFIPLIRAGYVFALVSGALTSNKSLSIFWVYMIWVITSLYIGALLFFVEEHSINPQVDTIWTSLWWAALDMTTVGSNINAMTATGKTIAIILSAEGLMLFPVFTVYVTNAVLKK
ncbi:MAG: two pore domain potassium channel family protein [Bacteroides sp.]|nr:two pore domain potassium channel family protein [Bacteroidales bacterium]MBD5379896.1 two pore domain potassium channel family protein [Bacteroides sp.]MDE5808831.1 two pore domain potassium channel family protein [Muribaculaceae bacterium]